MRTFLDSLRADLSDRRVLPLVVALCVALVAALGYAILGGHGSSAAPTPSAATASAPTSAANSGVAVTQVSLGTNKAVSETTSGAPRAQRNVSNPFKPLPTPKAKSATAGGAKPAGGASSSPSGAGGSGSSSSSSGSSQAAPARKPSKPAAQKPKQPAIVYKASVEFGLAANGAQAAQLKSYENLELSASIPSAKSPVVVFKGVTSSGKVGKFELAGEILVHGPAQCLPSAQQCLAIGLQVGQGEQLEYLPGNGAAVLYELKLTGIAQAKGK
jgi:cytoskeletal protein RodZ